MMRRPLTAILVVLVLTGCCTRPTASPSWCTGAIEPVDGLAKLPYAEDDLLRTASGRPGEGRLCAGEVFTVEKPLTVYRVWDRSRAYSEMGRWWSFLPPEGNPRFVEDRIRHLP